MGNVHQLRCFTHLPFATQPYKYLSPTPLSPLLCPSARPQLNPIRHPTMTATSLSHCLESVPEHPDLVQLPVTGTLPSYLYTSTLYRVGPGRYETTYSDGKPFKVLHWFDGFSLLHAFTIDASANTVAYRNRFLSKSLLRTIEATPSTAFKGIAFANSDPCRSLLGKFFQLWTSNSVDPETSLPPIPNISVTVQNIPGKGTVVRTDATSNLALDEENLEIDHFFTFKQLNPALSGVMSPAHGHYDADAKEFINVTCSLGFSKSEYNIFKVSSSGQVHILATFSDTPCYIHSFATTPKYVVLCIWPLEIKSLSVLWNQSVMDGMHFYPNHPTRYIVISRAENRVVAKYESPSFFCFHTVNAFDTPDGIDIDLCHYEDHSILESLSLDNLRLATDLPLSTLVRVSLPNLSTAIANRDKEPHEASLHTLSGHVLELPRVNPNYLRKAYRFVYGVSKDVTVFDVISKVNVETGERWVWGLEKSVVGEPIFVPNPEGQEEDDGSLLVVVLDDDVRESMLIVLDAKSMTEVARAVVPQIVPLGFHGMFKPTD